MFQFKFKRPLVAVGFLVALTCSLFTGCETGNTDGGAAKDDAGTGDQYVSDGGSGAKIELIAPSSIGVGQTAEFFVNLKDPQGNAIAFVRIFCESEKGIAIIEPSSGGVAFENTGPDGSMSGVIGGLTPGSFLFECRAPQGFNLVARQRIRITGEVPPGFEGFPGAAGGNMGGGVVVDDTPDVDDDGGVEVTSIAISDVSGSDVVQIDIVQQGDCDGSASTNDPEPFSYNNVTLSFKNNTSSDVLIKSVKFTVADSGDDGESGTLGTNLWITAGGTGSTTLPFTDVSGGSKVFAGGSDVVEFGTFVITFQISGVTESGESFTIKARTTRTFNNVNNC